MYFGTRSWIYIVFQKLKKIANISEITREREIQINVTVQYD